MMFHSSDILQGEGREHKACSQADSSPALRPFLQVILFHFLLICGGYWELTSPPRSQDAAVCRSSTDRLNITSVIKQIPERIKKSFLPLSHLREKFNYNRGCMQAVEKKIWGDKWIYRANDKTWGGITDRWKDRGCAANRQNAPVQSRAHLWEQEFVLLHFSRVASPVDLQRKKGG